MHYVLLSKPCNSQDSGLEWQRQRGGLHMECLVKQVVTSFEPAAALRLLLIAFSW
jgi:hypothetical protein